MTKTVPSAPPDATIPVHGDASAAHAVAPCSITLTDAYSLKRSCSQNNFTAFPSVQKYARGSLDVHPQLAAMLRELFCASGAAGSFRSHAWTAPSSPHETAQRGFCGHKEAARMAPKCAGKKRTTSREREEEKGWEEKGKKRTQRSPVDVPRVRCAPEGEGSHERQRGEEGK